MCLLCKCLWCYFLFFRLVICVFVVMFVLGISVVSKVCLVKGSLMMCSLLYEVFLMWCIVLLVFKGVIIVVRLRELNVFVCSCL